MSKCRTGDARRWAGWFLIALACTFSSLALADPTDPLPTDAPKESHQWFEPVEPGSTLRVSNPLGNVYARFGGYEDQVEILATFQKLDPALPALDVRRTRDESGLQVTAGHVAPVRSATASADRIDLVLFVPQGVQLDAETRDDLIEIKGLRGDVVASSIEGEIRIRSIRGRVRASSARGSIDVALENDATAASQELTTQTGDIQLHLWEDADADVRIATSGEISTDFSLDVEHRRFEEPGKHATAKIGEGGSQIFLTSKRGRVKLLRLQKNFRPDEPSGDDSGAP